MVLSLKLKPKTIAPLASLRRFSSSSSSPRPPPPPADSEGGGGGENEDSPPPPSRPYSSFFSDIKERLKSPPTPPRRIPTDPPPPPPLSSLKPAPPASLEEIRNNVAGFRMRSGGGPPPRSGERPPLSPPPPTISFQDLLKNNVLNKTGDRGAGEGGAAGKGAFSVDSIRESFRQFRPSPRDQTGPRRFDVRVFQDSLRRPAGEAEKGPSLIGGRETLPESIFGKELREKKGEGEGESKALRTEFVKMYSYDELGEKLRKLRPEEAMKGDKDWFSLSELNERLAKLRELEEKETESRMGGVSFWDLRESLVKVKEADASKKASSNFPFTTFLCLFIILAK